MTGKRSLLQAALVAMMLSAPVAQAEIMDTLERMREVALTLPGVASAEIDTSERVLKVVMQDGVESTFSPDNLDRTLATIDNAAAQDAAIAEFMTQTTTSLDQFGTLNASVLPQVRPVVTTTDYATSPDGAALGMWNVEIAPGLSEYLVIDSPTSVSYVTLDMIAESGLEIEAIREQARENLRKLVESAEAYTFPDEPRLAGLILDGFYECSVMLLPEVWTRLAEGHEGVIASCPARGELMFVAAEHTDVRAAMLSYNQEAVATRPYPVSAELYLWTGSAWQLLP
ncbi:hypothetical protein [Tabrizicola sp.]|uniref:hypothetical protein n=1 Tax=Tabrizicola sp. TaxID=2005166 RepID=UPI003F3E55E8